MLHKSGWFEYFIIHKKSKQFNTSNCCFDNYGITLYSWYTNHLFYIISVTGIYVDFEISITNSEKKYHLGIKNKTTSNNITPDPVQIEPTTAPYQSNQLTAKYNVLFISSRILFMQGKLFNYQNTSLKKLWTAVYAKEYIITNKIEGLKAVPKKQGKIKAER